MNVEAILRCVLFCFCIYGYIEYLSAKFNIKKEIIPVIVFSAIGSIIFVSGILNAMLYAAGLILLTGIVLGIIHVYQLTKIKKLNVSIPLIIFLCLSVYLYLWLSDVKYYAYDNFSYWGLIVKNLIINSQFPNFDDPLIIFQSYPPGSACFIWFVCKVIGYSEGHTLFAQVLFIISCGVALFGLIDKNQKLKSILLYMVVLYMCLCSITMNQGNNIYNLLVDIMLAAIAIAAFAIVEMYQNDVVKAAWLVSPLIVFEVCVKNSGLIWVIAIACLLLYHYKPFKRGILKKDCGMILTLSVLSPLIIRKLWDLHVEYVYPNGKNSFHAMTIEHYTAIFSAKTKDDLKNIHDLFIARVFAIDNKFLWIMACFVCAGLLVFLLNREVFIKSKYWFYLLYSMLIYVIYQIGNYCMYMFSMPLGEALYLAAYDRYVMTVEWFIIGIFIIYGLNVVASILKVNEDKRKMNILFICIVIIMCLSLKIENFTINMLIKKPVATGREIARDNLDSIIEKNKIKNKKKYMIYISNQNYSDTGYRSYMAKYVLYSDDVKVVSEDEFKTIDRNEISKYDYLIVLDRDDFIYEWLENNNYPKSKDCIFVPEEFG